MQALEEEDVNLQDLGLGLGLIFIELMFLLEFID